MAYHNHEAFENCHRYKDLNRSSSSHLNKGPTMKSIEDPMQTSEDLLFETERNNTGDDVQI